MNFYILSVVLFYAIGALSQDTKSPFVGHSSPAINIRKFHNENSQSYSGQEYGQRLNAPAVANQENFLHYNDMIKPKPALILGSQQPVSVQSTGQHYAQHQMYQLIPKKDVLDSQTLDSGIVQKTQNQAQDWHQYIQRYPEPAKTLVPIQGSNNPMVPVVMKPNEYQYTGIPVIYYLSRFNFVPQNRTNVGQSLYQNVFDSVSPMIYYQYKVPSYNVVTTPLAYPVSSVPINQIDYQIQRSNIGTQIVNSEHTLDFPVHRSNITSKIEVQKPVQVQLQFQNSSFENQSDKNLIHNTSYQFTKLEPVVTHTKKYTPVFFTKQLGDYKYTHTQQPVMNTQPMIYQQSVMNPEPVVYQQPVTQPMVHQPQTVMTPQITMHQQRVMNPQPMIHQHAITYQQQQPIHQVKHIIPRVDVPVQVIDLPFQTRNNMPIEQYFRLPLQTIRTYKPAPYNPVLMPPYMHSYLAASSQTTQIPNVRVMQQPIYQKINRYDSQRQPVNTVTFEELSHRTNENRKPIQSDVHYKDEVSSYQMKNENKSETVNFISGQPFIVSNSIPNQSYEHSQGDYESKIQYDEESSEHANDNKLSGHALNVFGGWTSNDQVDQTTYHAEDENITRGIALNIAQKKKK